MLISEESSVLIHGKFTFLYQFINFCLNNVHLDTVHNISKEKKRPTLHYLRSKNVFSAHDFTKMFLQSICLNIFFWHLLPFIQCSGKKMSLFQNKQNVCLLGRQPQAQTKPQANLGLKIKFRVNSFDSILVASFWDNPEVL